MDVWEGWGAAIASEMEVRLIVGGPTGRGFSTARLVRRGGSMGISN